MELLPIDLEQLQAADFDLGLIGSWASSVIRHRPERVRNAGFLWPNSQAKK